MGSSKRAVLTGAAGFIGSHLAEALLEEGWTVLGIDNLSTGRRENLRVAGKDPRFSLLERDILHPDAARAVEAFRPGVVYHLAAQIDVRASVRDPLRDARENILGTIAILEAARTAGATRFVLASSGGTIYGQPRRLPAREGRGALPVSPYGLSKRAAGEYVELYRRLFGMGGTSLALANVYGPRQDAAGEAGVVAIFTAAMLEGRSPVIYGDGTQTRDFVYVSDVCRAFLRAGEAPPAGLVNVGTGRETSILEVFSILAGLTGFRGEPVFAPARAGELYRSCLDPTRAWKRLGWRPETDLKEGLRLTVEAFRGGGRG